MQNIIINTNATQEQINQYKDEINRYDNGIIILKDKVIYKNQLLSQGIEYDYKDIANAYNIKELTKQDIITFIEKLNTPGIFFGFFVIVSIYLFIIYFTSALVDILMLAILGFIVSRIVGIKMKFKANFNMGVYALTLPTILNLIYIMVNLFMTFEVKYFQWMYTTISYIYIIVAILIIKSDLINKQIELMRIIDEQQKVKMEIEEREKQEEEEKNKTKDNNENDKKEEKKKSNKKEKGVDDSGLAPQE